MRALHNVHVFVCECNYFNSQYAMQFHWSNATMLTDSCVCMCLRSYIRLLICTINWYSSFDVERENKKKPKRERERNKCRGFYVYFNCKFICRLIMCVLLFTYKMTWNQDIVIKSNNFRSNYKHSFEISLWKALNLSIDLKDWKVRLKSGTDHSCLFESFHLFVLLTVSCDRLFCPKSWIEMTYTHCVAPESQVRSFLNHFPLINFIVIVAVNEESIKWHSYANNIQNHLSLKNCENIVFFSSEKYNIKTDSN